MSDWKPPTPRLKNGDLAMCDAMPFGQHFEARTTHPVEQCLHPDFFMNVRTNLRAGDRINVVRYDNDTWKRVLEVIEGVRVVYVDNMGVELLPTFAAVKLDKPGEEGIVIDRGFKNQFVIRVDGATHATRNTVVEAEEYAQLLSLESGKPWKNNLPKHKKAA